MHQLRRETWLPHPISDVFEFFSDAHNLERITPPWLGFRILTPDPIDLREGTLIDYRIQLYGAPLTWKTRIQSWNPPYEFRDVQLKGPYRVWNHLHQFTEERGGTRMLDVVDYELPFGPLGNLVQKLWVGRDVERIFAHRARVIQEIFEQRGRVLVK
jgi:ligand-binding SRPBCC domain-containing protein